MGYDPDSIREKFGDDYIASEQTFIMGIDQRFTQYFARRFKGLTVLESCTGGGFTTLSLAKTARHVFTVEINPVTREQAGKNLARAGLDYKVSFLSGDVMDPATLKDLPHMDAAFLDPDWAVTSADHVYRFRNSNTQPPADALLDRVFGITGNIGLVLPPFIPVEEFNHLPDHEHQRLYLGDELALFCLYFGDLMEVCGETEFRVPA